MWCNLIKLSFALISINKLVIVEIETNVIIIFYTYLETGVTEDNETKTRMILSQILHVVVIYKNRSNLILRMSHTGGVIENAMRCYQTYYGFHLQLITFQKQVVSQTVNQLDNLKRQIIEYNFLFLRQVNTLTAHLLLSSYQPIGRQKPIDIKNSNAATHIVTYYYASSEYQFYSTTAENENACLLLHGRNRLWCLPVRATTCPTTSNNTRHIV